LDDEVLAIGSPVFTSLIMDAGFARLTGAPPPATDGTDIMTAPRRIRLDKVLVDAAVSAGAELRENCIVQEILMQDGRVTGIRCQQKGGVSVIEKAKIVIGADGKHSILANAVKAEEYHKRPALSFWYYTYWSDFPSDDFTLYARPGMAMGTIPTNDNQVLIGVSWAAARFHEFRKDIEGNYRKSLGHIPGFLDMLDEAYQDERFKAMADLPGFFRRSYGPGWALIGDAAYHKDPVTAQGIFNAFESAANVAAAIDHGFSGRGNLEELLARNEKQRDEERMAMYEFTCEWASLADMSPEQEALLIALQGNQLQTNRFMGTFAGTYPIHSFFAPENIEQIMAIRD
jgi:flavin-dependent dehydrogenase